MGIRGRRVELRRRRGAGIRAQAQCGITDRSSGARTLVQPFRFAARVAGHDAASRGGGLVVLPAFLYGAVARRRFAEAVVRGVPELYACNGNLPMVAF